MIAPPLPPQQEKLPLLGALRAYSKKGCEACAPQPVDLLVFSAKYLNGEQNSPTDCAVLYTGCVSSSTDCAVFSTDAVFRFLSRFYLHLSLFKKKERKKEGVFLKSGIHGYEQLPKKEATGFLCRPRVFRGLRGVVFANGCKGLIGDARGIHVSTGCFAGGVF